ncbi:ATPase [Acholeplasma equirhinis]|uniref:ATP synthase subunit C n=1 Tax=Acholeplasma equirhinis TaxID=555393 RepID=UPI00197AB3EF|nr:ATP synthase subunit C [Acholeplasma equirhinis]MBN3491188.1 ATPase [Acholeplasma equirhinis]
MEWILLTVIVLGVFLIALPLISVFKGQVSALSAKKRIIAHIAMFATFFFALVLVTPGIFGVEVSDPGMAESGLFYQAAAFGYLGAAISTGASALGAGIAVAAAAPAAIGAISENPKNLGKSLIFVALGEGVAIYGLLISILIINNIPTIG